MSIAGIGADIVAIERLDKFYQRHGRRALERLLAPGERDEFARLGELNDPGRFLAKRFAAKEALGKALGIGVSPPATLTNSAVIHDARGRPAFVFAPPLADWLEHRRLQAHLTISDERAYAVAFVVLETTCFNPRP